VKNHLVGILPAAGRGSRLGPIPCSKEIMPLGFGSQKDAPDGVWRPVTAIETHINAHSQAGAERIAVIIGPGKDDIVHYLGDGSRYGVSLTYMYQEDLLGMPYALNLARPWIGESSVIFSMPDTLISPSNLISELAGQHLSSANGVTLALFPTSTPERFGMVELDTTATVTRIVDKPLDSQLNLMWGFAVWSSDFTEFMHDYLGRVGRKDEECVLGDVFSDALTRQMKVGQTVFHDGRYIDIGTPRSFQSAVRELALVGDQPQSADR